MNPYYLMPFPIVTALIGDILMRVFGGKLACAKHRYLFNAVTCFIAALCALIGCGFIPVMCLHTFLCGLALGLCVAGDVFFFLRAMNEGHMGLQQLIAGGAGMLIPMATGVLVLDEKATVVQIIGIVLMFTAFFLTVNVKGDKGVHISGRWVVFVLLRAVSIGTMGIIQQEYLEHAFLKDVLASPVDDFKTELLPLVLVAMTTATGLFLVLGVLTKEKERGAYFTSRKHIVFGALGAAGYGVCMFTDHSMAVVLLSMIPSLLYFPLFNGIVLVSCGLLDRFVFKERFNFQQIIGYVLGIFAIMMVAGVFG